MNPLLLKRTATEPGGSSEESFRVKHGYDQQRRTRCEAWCEERAGAAAGGKGGGTAKIGSVLAENLIEDQAVALARKIIAFYREQGKFPERLGATIERVGFDTFVKAVT